MGVAEIEEEVGIVLIERGRFAEEIRGLRAAARPSQLHHAHVVGNRRVGVILLQRAEARPRFLEAPEMQFRHRFEERGTA